MAVKIEKGIGRASHRRHDASEKYPFSSMKVGDSIVCDAPHPSSKYQAAKFASFRHAPKVFKGGTGEDGKPRIWRVT